MLKKVKTAPVDTLLAVIGKEGTDVSAVLAAQNSENIASTPKVEEKTENPKEETKVDTTTSTNSSGGRIFASPLAKKIAKIKELT